MNIDWSDYLNFTEDEMRCKHTGLTGMDAEFMHKLQKLRTAYGAPLVITSAYRHRSHPLEVNKSSMGAHTHGRAVDIRCQGFTAHAIAALALAAGFTGIGVSQNPRGARFLHLDTMTKIEGFPRPTLYSY